eukprot:6456630-Amphidinium_carterae.1
MLPLEPVMPSVQQQSLPMFCGALHAVKIGFGGDCWALHLVAGTARGPSCGEQHRMTACFR